MRYIETGHRKGSRPWALLGALLLGAGILPASASDLPSRTAPPSIPAMAAQGWTFNVNLYAWAAGLDGRVRTLPPLPSVNVNIGFNDVLKNLDVALMGSVEARLDRFILFSDLIYSRLSPEKGFTVAGFPVNATIESTSFIGLAAAGYRFVSVPGFTLDGFAGARGFSMSNTLTLQSPGGSIAYGKDEQWLDGVVGARARYALSDKLTAIAIGFVGAGGSKYHWDLYGGLNYAFSERWSAFAGYRALKVDFAKRHFIYDTTQHGPVTGVHIRF
jgi:hypothetical protein